MVVFDCPDCEYQSGHLSVITAIPHVFLHFYRDCDGGDSG